MLRAKDLANYSSEDKSAIFGGVPYGVAAAPVEAIKEEAKAQDVGSESEVPPVTLSRTLDHATAR
jgi:hypothetical protein